MGNVLATLLGLIGIATPPPPPEPNVQMIDPATINFSMSTIASDLPAMEAGSPTISSSDLIMHEDEWRQIEFYPQGRLAEVQATVERLVAFEAENRNGSVFRNIFLRALPAEAMLDRTDAVAALATELSATAASAPILYTGADQIVGRVANGFSLSLGSNVSLYGLGEGSSIAVLGANLGDGGDHEVLARAFMRLSGQHRLIAVDWRSHMVLTSVNEDGQIEVWRPD